MIVVTGATGNVGRPLVRALVEAGEQVTTVSRGASARPGVRHVRADLTRPESLTPALEGATALFLLASGDFTANNGAALGAVLELARDVERVVLLSSQGVGTGRHAPDLEEAVTRSDLEWTVLRPGGFASNSYAWAGTIREQRSAAAPFADVALPVIDPDDIAGVAAAALREAGHGGQTYVLTGPEAITPRQQVAAIGDAVGEPVRFVELSRAEARAGMTAFMPEVIADATLDILGTPTADEQRVSPDVERVLGRPAGSFADWAARNAAAFK
ncbi:uncharacterized protein YbjT (DUF2867 family) [Saccharothrix carnea]|uniref:Uncharacterized protein YbjT (DUF2867 family) n=1 Tax=Saccharothrix carnea TaxID=1280637 RepID=A0A2P8I4W5_SACCR|nr:NAD(P)H-binding protein [Saccharothrix carnea]PSL53488.1 uncharacterized protein YbjT (DUF2867 family) [Saccharothrix carnea]